MKTINIFFILILFVTSFIYPQEKQFISDNLEIIKLNENAFIHISYMETPIFGRFP